MQARIAAFCFLALGLYAAGYALQLRMVSQGGPGAGLFPMIAGVGLCLASLLWLAQVVRQPATGRVEIPRGAAAARIVLQLLALVAFALLMRPLGYIPVALGLVVATALIAGARNWFWIAVVALIASFGFEYGASLLGAHL